MTSSAVAAPLAPAGQLLGLTTYDPGSTGSYTTTTTLADVDATNLAVTFTAPASGKVFIRLTAQAYPNASTGSLVWGLREASSAVATPCQVAGDTGVSLAVSTYSRGFFITGLTPGTVHTYKWAANHASNSWVIRWGGGTGGTGAAIMEVWDAATSLGSITAPAGTLLAVKLNTASGNVATTSSTQADIDATNAAITFTAPASGNVLVRVTATANMSANNQNAFLGLREATTNLVNSPTGTIFVQGQTATPLESPVAWVAYLTGVSAGAHTYKVSFAVNGGATLTMRGSVSAPMTIEVWAAP